VPGSGWQSEAVMDKTLCETFETVSEARFVSVQDNSNLRKLLMDVWYQNFSSLVLPQYHAFNFA